MFNATIKNWVKNIPKLVVWCEEASKKTSALPPKSDSTQPARLLVRQLRLMIDGHSHGQQGAWQLVMSNFSLVASDMLSYANVRFASCCQSSIINYYPQSVDNDSTDLKTLKANIQRNLILFECFLLMCEN